MSDSSSDSEDLSLSFSACSVDSEASYESGLEAEVVEPYQFEPEASDSLAESSTEDSVDSGDEEWLLNKDWRE